MREHCGTRESSAAAGDAQRLAGTAPASATDLVSNWQRSLGNAAVSRILAREATPGGAQIDPLIKTARGPILGEYGQYRWLVTYHLPSPALVSGWLIQELYMESKAKESIGPEHFWECWRVRSGEQVPAEQDDEAGSSYDDRYVRGAGDAAAADPKGWHRHTGVIRFYPGSLPPEFGEDSGKHGYQTRSKPTGWTGQGTRHDAYSEWDYPGGQKRLNGFVAYAGTTELRAGDRVQFRPRTTSPASQPTPRRTAVEAEWPVGDDFAEGVEATA